MNKISVNKLSEYLQSDALRRRRIIEEQKEPLEFIVTRYRDAKEAIIKYLRSSNDIEIIDKAIDNLRKKRCITDFEKNDRKNSIEALESFLKIGIPESLLAFSLSKPRKRLSLLRNGLQVNINPELIIKGAYRKRNIIGGIKIHISKTNPLNEEMQKNVTTLLHEVIEETMIKKSNEEQANLNFCFSIDVFNHSILSAPKSFKKRRKVIDFACDEINLLWDSI